MHYFSTKFSKIAKHWGLSAPSAFNRVTWSCVIRPNSDFSNWLWEIEL